jgi:hypothetical protein
MSDRSIASPSAFSPTFTPSPAGAPRLPRKPNRCSKGRSYPPCCDDDSGGQTHIAGPYGLYGLGMALYFATQGFGSVIWTVTANAVRLLASAGGALVAVTWLDLGAIGFFIAIAGGFCAYAALTAAAMFRVKQPSAPPTN